MYLGSRFWHTQRGALVFDFLAAKSTERGLAPSTREGYVRTLTEFIRSLGRGRALRHVLESQIHSYLSACYGRGLSASSIAGRISVLRGFFRHLQSEHGLGHDPMLRFASPRQWKLLPRVLSPEEACAMIEQPPGHERQLISQALNLRDRALSSIYLTRNGTSTIFRPSEDACDFCK